MRLSMTRQPVARRRRLPNSLPFRSLAFFFLTFLVSAAGGAARAAELTPQQKQDMKALYERATRAYDVGKYNEAIEEYQKAYEIGGDPPMLYNIAQAYRLNDQPTEALRFYRRYLQRAPNARNREDVERKIAEQEKLVEAERQKKAQQPAPPVVTPPPAAIAPTSPSGPSPGAGAAGPSTAPVGPGPSGTGTGQVPATPPAAPEETSNTRTIISWVVVGVGVALGAGAAIAGKIAKDQGDSVTAMSNLRPSVPFDATFEQKGQDANTVAIVLGIAGGAAIVTGVVLLLTGGSSAESPAPPPVTTARATVTPWFGGGLVGAGANLRF
jgi:hypothetical protein